MYVYMYILFLYLYTYIHMNVHIFTRVNDEYPTSLFRSYWEVDHGGNSGCCNKTLIPTADESVVYQWLTVESFSKNYSQSSPGLYQLE